MEYKTAMNFAKAAAARVEGTGADEATEKQMKYIASLASKRENYSPLASSNLILTKKRASDMIEELQLYNKPQPDVETGNDWREDLGIY